MLAAAILYALPEDQRGHALQYLALLSKLGPGAEAALRFAETVTRLQAPARSADPEAPQ